jgi:hypothetical protein
MTIALRVLVAAGTVALLAAAQTGGSGADAANPFYLVPSKTTECQRVKNCVGVVGPWVEVPAHGEATFLFSCPSRRDFVVGGTDARASSSKVRVWFDGRLGAPIGSPPPGTTAGAFLLFHATASDERHGWFQPILGCVSLTQKTKRSTVSVVPGVRPAAPLDLRVVNVELRLDGPLAKPTTTLRCPKRETLVGHWSAFAVSTQKPPGSALAGAVAIAARAAGNAVEARFHPTRTFGHLVPLATAQVGAMCEPQRP